MALFILVVSSCSIPATASVIIVDQKSQPVKKAGITVVATYSNQKTVTTTTLSDGSASLTLQSAVYPVVITATDGTNGYSKVTLSAAADAANKISIVQSTPIIKAL
jgi:hypothetical protein